MINAFLYSVYGSVSTTNRKAASLLEYRHRWLKALIVGRNIEAVIALGTLADEAWKAWAATPEGRGITVAYVPITHPTQPESSSKGDKEKLRTATKTMLKKWSEALQTLHSAIAHPDSVKPFQRYGDTWQPGDKVPIPEIDLPPGLPRWMREQDNWARRTGTDVNAKRRNITLTVPVGVAPEI
jgi:hypothetical protein